MSTARSIRDATLADAPALAAIYNASIAAGDSTMDEEEKSAEAFRLQIAHFHEREALLVMLRDDEVIGWGIIKRYSDRAGYRFACETSVYFRRDLTGQGYGSLLQEARMARCRRLGYHHILARIMAVNQGSIRFHERFGYEIVGVQREIGFKRGRSTWSSCSASLKRRMIRSAGNRIMLLRKFRLYQARRLLRPNTCNRCYVWRS